MIEQRVLSKATWDRIAPYMAYVINTHHITHAERRNTKYVGRGSMWGNPHRIDLLHPRMAVLREFLALVAAMTKQERIEWLYPIATALRHGHKLRCFCAPLPCHAAIVAMFAIEDAGMANFWVREGGKPTHHDQPLHPIDSSGYTLP